MNIANSLSQFQKYLPGQATELFVKNILVYEQPDNIGDTILPFFADGYPGLMFHITPGGQWVLPQNKQMPVSYLYGQTLHPIELHLKGSYKIIVFQLYPFVLYTFFGLESKDLNDACYDLQKQESWKQIEETLLLSGDTKKQIDLINSFLLSIFLSKQKQLDYIVRDAVQLILDSKAQISIREVSAKLFVTPRTFERRFLKQVGITARDFIQITKFQLSLEQLATKDYTKLTDIVYTNGFTDQSHFTKVFKAFTGQTPGRFMKD